MEQRRLRRGFRVRAGVLRTLPSALALSLIFPTSGHGQRPSSAPRMDLNLTYTQFTLDNGLNVLVHTDRSQPMVAVNLWYHVGSKNEEPGRTGFAHLFEHMMFEGSANVKEGEFDRLLEEAGGMNNGSTSPDRTNYWITVPTGGLERALWLEADRMGWLLDAVDQEKLDTQRSVVMNERRQSYENRPYGLAWETLLAGMYPPSHPYRWPTIGSMEDLEAATLEDVRDFFRRFYHPGNASLALVGDVSVERARRLVERWFGDIPEGPPVSMPDVASRDLAHDRRDVLEDAVQLPRLDLAWHSPGAFAEGDAELELAAAILGRGKASRLYRRLVVEEALALSVDVDQEGDELGGLFVIEVMARSGVELERVEAMVMEELLRLAEDGPEPTEVAREVAQQEADFVRSLERVGGFGGKADLLNRYFVLTGDPGFIRRDLARFTRATPEGIMDWVRRTLVDAPSYGLSIVPRGRTELAAPPRP